MALQGLGGVARGIVNTLLISLSLRAVAPEDRATGMGIYQAIYAAGMLAGPVASGYLAQASSLAAVFYLLAAVSLAAGLLGLLPAIPRRPRLRGGRPAQGASAGGDSAPRQASRVRSDPGRGRSPTAPCKLQPRTVDR